MFKLAATGCHKLHSIFPGEKYNESDSGEDAGDAGSMFSQVVRPGDIFDDGADLFVEKLPNRFQIERMLFH